ncbi:MAG TPA: acyl-CoA dehydrogenase family protein [Acidimicrobiia bacterium]|nr:acyl-CoA dehydrogenase family protein [Acidimicrobiia bacterium]
MDATEVELFERSVRQAAADHTAEALDRALTDLGWPDALSDDPYTAVSILFPVQGAANATSSALDQVVATGLGMGPRTTEAVVLPRLGMSAVPGVAGDDGVSVDGLGTRASTRAETAVVAARGDAGQTFFSVAVADLRLEPVRGMDPELGLVRVTADGVAPGSRTEPSARAWPTTVVLARLGVSYEMLGAARAMLALAREHALERIQYGGPISRFQAVRHRLADTLVAIEGAEAAVNAARSARSPELATVAKALAGGRALTAASHCQQVLAGIGFTAEHSFHRYFRRILVLDQLFGSAHALTAELGEELLRSRALPDLLPLEDPVAMSAPR